MQTPRDSDSDHQPNPRTDVPTLLILSQVYVPDPASVGQHMHDGAREMVGRGYRVVVFTADRGYENPERRYPRREVMEGVEVRRLRWSSFGKRSIPVRLIGGVIFVAQAAVLGMFVRGLRGVLVSTSPPFAPLAAGVIRAVGKVPFTYWAMDLNPDQAIAMGKTRPGSIPARLFNALNRFTLGRAAAVVTNDRFMGQRLEDKAPVGDRLKIVPPWPHQEHLTPVPHADNPFRAEHDLADKFVIMFSGNISPSHPVRTVLEAAKQLQSDPSLLFMFIGGGLGKAEIEAYGAEHGLTNVRTLGYQPMERIKYSLSAADVHLVSMGENMVGIVHPCKAYGAMAVQRPILLLGPARSHVGEMIERFKIGWRVDHGDVDGAVRTIQQLRGYPTPDLASIGEAARQTITDHYSESNLTSEFGDVLEQAMGDGAWGSQDQARTSNMTKPYHSAPDE